MNEDELIEKLLQREKIAFEETYFIYKDLIFKAVCKYVDVFEDAEELVQDVFVIAFRKISQFNRTSKLSTWLIKIAINTSKNFLESISKQKEVIKQAIDIYDMGEHDGCYTDIPNPEELSLQKEGRNVLIKAISKLSADQNTACTLFYLEGLQQIDIAETMNTSLDAVQSLIHRGKIRLRSILKLTNKKFFYETNKSN